MERSRWIALPAPSRVVNQKRHDVNAPMDGLEQFGLGAEAAWWLQQQGFGRIRQTLGNRDSQFTGRAAVLRELISNVLNIHKPLDGGMP